MIDNARRNFLRARSVREPATPFRPPWAIPEADFLARCTRCGDCVTACSRSGSALLKAGDGGFPVAAFNPASCSFCGDCVAACAPAALDPAARQRGEPAWAIKAAIGDCCLARKQVVCRSCGESCDVGAILFRPRRGGVSLPELRPEDCSGCGACVAVCPVSAISMLFATTSTPPATTGIDDRQGIPA